MQIQTNALDTRPLIQTLAANGMCSLGQCRGRVMQGRITIEISGVAQDGAPLQAVGDRNTGRLKR